MSRQQREVYDEGQAASWLRVPVAAWRWAAGSGLIPPADAGAGQWSRAVVEATDAEQVRAALRGPVGAGWAAERLMQALGLPLPLRRSRVTAAAVGYLVRAGLLAYLGGEVEFPEVHPDQVAALARRRDLPALLDRHVPLGPDQAAVRLGVRRADWDHVVRLAWITPTGTATVEFGRAAGGSVEVPLFSAVDIALLPVARPLVDWREVRRTGLGRRSPLASLASLAAGEDTVTLAEAGQIAGVNRATTGNWSRRLPQFPNPVVGTEKSPLFDRAAVVGWLLTHGKITIPAPPSAATMTVLGTGGDPHTVRVDYPRLILADDAEGTDRLSGWAAEGDVEALAELGEAPYGMTIKRLTAVAGAAPLAVLGDVRVSERSSPAAGRAWIELSWPARVRGSANSAEGVVRHGVTYVGRGEECVCTLHDCGGIAPVLWCPEHGGIAPRMKWHPGGGIRCSDLTRGRSVRAASTG
ncbi:hypothetical protein ACE1OC_43295 (plasmid) [Streptomyces sp. DSM 116496]|uniref:hypothetical protein n=1 Tax=Streptomyces stoeckheimensis TaxID=3344656 RepID=UPI0038B3105F